MLLLVFLLEDADYCINGLSVFAVANLYPQTANQFVS